MAPKPKQTGSSYSLPDKEFEQVEMHVPMGLLQMQMITRDHCNLHDAILDLNLIEIEQSQIPLGGRLVYFLENWEKVTSDQIILTHIQGFKIDFMEIPFQGVKPKLNLSVNEKQILDLEIGEMLEKQAVEIANPNHSDQNQYFSTLFVRPKKDGGLRPIFNLKSLNKMVVYEHFKMEGFHMVKNILQPNDLMVKVDLKDAYFCIPIHETHRKYLRFQWEGKVMQYRVLPFGLASGPRLFTNVMKPIVAILRRVGVRLIIYLDDIIIMNQTVEGITKDRDSLLHLLTAWDG